ncbi:MAG: hypothetical protein Aurels2KO_47160 [Aureliella sp.]
MSLALMQSNANVVSVEQLEVLHHQLMHYRSKMEKELDLLALETRRLETWINSDAPQYWRSEMTMAQRRLAECKDALTRCQSYVRADEKRPCTEEKKRVQRAMQRSRLCEEMLQRTSEAQRHWQQEHVKNVSKVQRLRDLVESELLVAAAELQKDIDNLHRYAAVTTKRGGTSSPAESETTVSKQSATGTETTAEGDSAGPEALQ